MNHHTAIVLIISFVVSHASAKCYILMPGSIVSEQDVLERGGDKMVIEIPANASQVIIRQKSAPSVTETLRNSAGAPQIESTQSTQPLPEVTTIPPISSEQHPIIDTKSGKIQGKLLKSDPQNVYGFLGIPYAEPPINDLRFLHPVPIKPWQNLYQATQMPFPCLQTDFYINNNLTISTDNSTEDCLYLNVWTPSRNCILKRSCHLKPVMVFIYGGTFQFGSSGWDWYDGTQLASLGDVVVVTLNYRVGPLGFLYSATTDAPGNAGLYDQLLAMKWVQENIRMFGGDPHQVTLMGQSAGAIAIGYHMVSPLTKGLFNRVILESGSPYFKIGDHTRDGPKKVEKLASAMGCLQDGWVIETHAKELVSCLKTKNGRALLQMSGTIFGVHALTFFPIYGDAFIPDKPQTLMDQGKIHNTDLLIGSNKDEGSYFVFYLFGRTLKLDQPQTVTKYEIDLYVTYGLQLLLRQNVRPVRMHYLEGIREHEGTKALQKAAEAVGDMAITCPTKYFAEMFSKNNKVYYYQFNHRSKFSTWPSWVGATHGDEVFYVFGYPLTHPSISTPEEREFSKTIIKTWTTFAKTGKVIDLGGQIWPEYTTKNPVFMQMAPNKFSYGRGPNDKNCNFWKSYLLKN